MYSSLLCAHPSFLLIQNRSCKLPNSVGSLSGWGTKTYKVTEIHMTFAPDVSDRNVSAYECEHTRVCVCVCVCVTKVWLSTRVTSAQKLEMDIAMVFPLKPSEGFPINPTLWVITYLEMNSYSVCLSGCVRTFKWVRKEKEAFICEPEKPQSSELNSNQAEWESFVLVFFLPGIWSACDWFSRIVFLLGGVVGEPPGVVWQALRCQEEACYYRRKMWKKGVFIYKSTYQLQQENSIWSLCEDSTESLTWSKY